MAKRGRGEHGRRLSSEDREELERRIAAGETQEDVAGAIGCDVRTVIRWIMHNGGLRSYERKRSPRNLSLAEREEIAVADRPGRVWCGDRASFGPGVFDDHSGDLTQRWPPAVSGHGG